MMLYLRLFWEFLKTGLFAVGGGLATIPFLYDMMEKFHWFTREDLMNMIAVSESTPGPMGINMATYVGYQATGGSILGGIITTAGLVIPSMVIICIIAKFLQMFKESHWVQDAFYGLRPAVTAMIAVAGIGVFEASVTYSGSFFPLDFGGINWLMLGLCVLVFLADFLYKKLNPILLIALCALLGIILQL